MPIVLRFRTSSTQLSANVCSPAAQTKRFWNGVLLTVVNPIPVRSTYSMGLCKRLAGATRPANDLAPCFKNRALLNLTANAQPASISSNSMKDVHLPISVNGNRLDSLDPHHCQNYCSLSL